MDDIVQEIQNIIANDVIDQAQTRASELLDGFMSDEEFFRDLVQEGIDEYKHPGTTSP